MEEGLAIFEDYEIRRVYDEASETWYFSVIDIVQALTQQVDYQAARNYWKVLKSRLKNEGSEVVTNCHRLKMRAQDGKQRKKGRGIAKKARVELEEETKKKKKVVTANNYLPETLVEESDL